MNGKSVSLRQGRMHIGQGDQVVTIAYEVQARLIAQSFHPAHGGRFARPDGNVFGALTNLRGPLWGIATTATF